MNIGRLFVLVIFTALLAAFLSGCGASLDPVATVKAFNQASAKGELEKAQKYIAKEKRTGDEKNFNYVREMMQNLPAGAKESMDSVLQGMTYELVSQEGNKATVRTMMDISSMMKEYTGTPGSPMMGMTKMSINYILEKRGMRWQIVDAKPAMGM